MSEGARTQLNSPGPASVASSGETLRRNCACGNHTSSGGECRDCKSNGLVQRFPRQAHLTGSSLELGATDNSLEHQADDVANRMMRMPAGASPVGFVPAASGTTTGRVPSTLSSQIYREAAGGEPLDQASRRFFEPRFGYDLSGVRLHRGAAAESLAENLGARAFTVGSHVFFNSGAYQPHLDSGRQMLAHELTHVVQQESGMVSRQVQRATINYRQLTWSDFQGSVPASSTLSAETDSGFDSPEWAATVGDTDTKEVCEVNNKKSTKHTAKLSIDPKVFDKVVGIMKQGTSWVLPKYKDPTKHCPGVVTQCKQEIDKQIAGASQDCKQHVTPCQEAFDKKQTSYTIDVDSTTKVTATSRAECATTLVSNCEKSSAKKQLFEITETNTGVQVVKATSKADCSSKKFTDDCLTYYKDWSARLLKHEQGHFDISNKMAEKARADLKTKSAKFVASATVCGKTEANKEAVKNFKAMDPSTAILAIGQGWITLKDQAQKDYDKDTKNGVKAAEQATWEKDIAAGLTAYDLNKPAAPTTPPKTPAPASPNPGGPIPDLSATGRPSRIGAAEPPEDS